MLTSTPLPRETGLLALWSETELRRMLRMLRRPYLLQVHPTAQALCCALEMENAYEAVTLAITEAFQRAGPAGRCLFEIILRCDFQGELTQTVASELGFSERQFFRQRADALKHIAVHVRDLLEGHQEWTRGAAMLARLLQSANPRLELESWYRRIRLGEDGERCCAYCGRHQQRKNQEAKDP